MRDLSLKLLYRVKEILYSENVWSQECLARDIRNNLVVVGSANAERFSLHGAIIRSGIDLGILFDNRSKICYNIGVNIVNNIARNFKMVLDNSNSNSLSHYRYDDSHTYEEVMDLLDDTIEYTASLEELMMIVNMNGMKIRRNWDELYEKCSLCGAKCYTDLASFSI